MRKKILLSLLFIGCIGLLISCNYRETIHDVEIVNEKTENDKKEDNRESIVSKEDDFTERVEEIKVINEYEGEEQTEIRFEDVIIKLEFLHVVKTIETENDIIAYCKYNSTSRYSEDIIREIHICKNDTLVENEEEARDFFSVFGDDYGIIYYQSCLTYGGICDIYSARYDSDKFYYMIKSDTDCYFIDSNYGGLENNLTAVDIDDYMVAEYWKTVIEGCGPDNGPMTVSWTKYFSDKEREQQYDLSANKDNQQYTILYKCNEIDSEPYYVATFDLFCEDELVQTLELNDYASEPQFLDLNFDGYVDFKIDNRMGTYNTYVWLYVWNQKEKIFEKVICEEDLCQIEVCDGYIKNWVRASSIGGYYYQELEWDGNILIKIKEEYVEPIDINPSQESEEMKIIEEKLPNRLYAMYDGKIYFRQYSADDKSSGEVFGNFSDVMEVTEKDLMCMDQSGDVIKVGTDSGIGTMLIVDGYLYSQRRESAIFNKVYVRDLEGSSEKEFESADIVGIIGNQIICTGRQEGIYVIDTEKREERLLVSDAEDYLFTANDRIYYTEYSQSGEAYIYDISLTGEQREIAKISSDDVKEYTDSDTEYVKIVCTQIASNKIYFSAGSYGGSAGEYQGGIIARVNADGTGFEILRESNYEKFYILNEDAEVIIEGEKIAEPYFSEEYDLYFIKDADSEEKILLSRDEYESLGLGGYADYTENSYWGISEIEVVGDKLFFAISIGKREENQDIGWRPYYIRELTSIYWKNMTTGEIYKLYSY